MARLARDEVERGLGWTWNPRRIARTMGRIDTLSVVAMRGDRPAGFAIASYSLEHMHVLLIALRPSDRGLGLGRTLMDWHLRCARTAGLRAVTLELRAVNEKALMFYERLGFEVVGRTEGYYQASEDALHMRLMLREDRQRPQL